MRDKNGIESMITRWVDENDQQQIVRYFENIFSILINHTNSNFRFWNVERPKFIDFTSVHNSNRNLSNRKSIKKSFNYKYILEWFRLYMSW